jgi:hypothetical protein
MSYWGAGPDGCDFSFSAIGVAVLRLKRKMYEDIEGVKEDNFSEQSIIASLVCLRLIGQEFPNNLSVHFRKKDYLIVKKDFYDWYENTKNKIPRKYQAGVLKEAEEEFEKWESSELI